MPENAGGSQSTEPTPALSRERIDTIERKTRVGEHTEADVLALVAEVRRGRLVATNLAEALREHLTARHWLARHTEQIADCPIATCVAARAALSEYQEATNG